MGLNVSVFHRLHLGQKCDITDASFKQSAVIGYLF